MGNLKRAKRAQTKKSKREDGKCEKKACSASIRKADAIVAQNPKRNPMMDFLAKNWGWMARIAVEIVMKMVF